MSLALPHVFDDQTPVDGQNIQDTLDIIAAQFPVGAQNISNSVLVLAVAGTQRKVAFGSASYAFPGGAALGAFGTGTITHGLGNAPVSVALTNANTFGDTDARLTVTGVTATTITVQGRATVAVGAGGSFPILWLAVA